MMLETMRQQAGGWGEVAAASRCRPEGDQFDGEYHDRRAESARDTGWCDDTGDEIRKTLETIADGFVQWPRAPIYHRRDEAGLAYEDVTFPSEDGVPLEGWFIPAATSDKLIICNHPRWFSRSGLPSHLEPWSRFAGATGNDFEVDFIPDYKILHDVRL
jgi:hypothetical protein